MLVFRHYLAVVAPLRTESTGTPLEPGEHRWQATCDDFPNLIGTGMHKREAVHMLEFRAQAQVRAHGDCAPRARDHARGKVYLFLVECNPDLSK